MSARRALNMIEFRITENMDTKEFRKVENMMNGPMFSDRLRISATPQTMQSGPIKVPDWWDDGDDSTIEGTRKTAQQIATR